MTLKRQAAQNHGERGIGGCGGGLFIHRPHIKNSSHQASNGLEEMTFVSVPSPKSPEGFGRTLVVRETCKALCSGFTEAPFGALRPKVTIFLAAPGQRSCHTAIVLV